MRPSVYYRGSILDSLPGHKCLRSYVNPFWEERFADGPQPDGDSPCAWIRMAKHSIAQIAGSSQFWLHLSSCFSAPFCCFQGGPYCLRSWLVLLFQRVYEGIECVEHGAIARRCATQFANGPATLFQRLHPLRALDGAGAPENVAAAQKKYSIEGPR